MVPTLAPNPRRREANAPVQKSWTDRFRKASATRRNRKTSYLTLASCAILLPVSLSTQSQAFERSNKSQDSKAKSRKNESSQLLSTETVSISSEALPQPNPSQQDEAKPDSPSATPEIPASSPSQPLLQLSPSSEPAPAQLENDSQPVTSTEVETAANVAESSVSSLPKVTPVAPVQNRTATVPTATVSKAAQHKIHFSAIVSGQTRQAQIAVTPKMTVGQALAAMGISLAVLDRVVPDASALAKDGMSVRISRISAKTEKRRTSIPSSELRYQPTTLLKPGAQKTVQLAKAGAVEITERVWRKDGKITKREFVSRHVAAAPQPKIVALGVKPHLMPGAIAPHRRYARALSYRGGSPRDRMLAPANPNTFAAVKSLSVVATGYAAGRAGGAIGSRTATGVRCTYGAIAVDPRLIPLGSRLYIEGYGYGFACDTGGAIKGNHIDLAFDSPSAAMRHGRRRMKVWILN